MSLEILIGMCGRSGSGKGYVCDLFRDFGIPSVDTDGVYRTLTAAPGESECMRELTAYFGDEIRLPDGSLDRKKLASIVFSGDGEKLSMLNRITHKHILADAVCQADGYFSGGAPAVIIDAPALFESGFDKRCEYTCAVVCDEDRRVRRICRRDGITEDAARARLASQISDSELAEKCDFLIRNNGDDTETVADIKAMIHEIFGEN